MRTVKDLPLSELIPNQAAQNAIRQAGKRIAKKLEELKLSFNKVISY